MGYSISPASLRLDDLTEPIVRLLRKSGERSITIAPETGSDRLRRVINKTVTNDEILAATELIFANDIDNLKLYYMIGLPTETEADLAAIRDLTVQMRDDHAEARPPPGAPRAHRRQRESAHPEAGNRLSVDADGGSRDHRRARASGCGSCCRGLDNVYFNIKSERHSYYQALLSLGDRRVAADDRGGRAQRRPVARRRCGDRPRCRVSTSSATGPSDAVLPWDIIDGGMKAAFFHSEFDKGLREEWTLPPKRQKENLKLLPVLD